MANILLHPNPTDSANGLCLFTVRRTVCLTGLRDVHVVIEAAGCRGEDLVCQSAGCPEVGQELETEADHKVPYVSGHL